ncbi:response regulator [Sphingomonas sp. BN140010]|uniref:histidine kinase n=1 Tax=Sphingomonas arvum TaxID=2992113 RepID=A0ABT3JFR3_9SPHN|nr:hybrid sensor histidine kinase/response regulator [Sphingomonas sp. BN140010]MCW3797918.1 response regulator [Sphingomonas sp. BN140010]
MNILTPIAEIRTVRVLHLEDSDLDAELVREFLGMLESPCEIDRVWTADGFSTALHDKAYDLILADHALPTFDGEAALEIARSAAPLVPFIFVSGTLGEDVAVEAMRRGATDYVVKQRLDRLPVVVQRALAEAAERSERRRAQAALRDSEANFETLVHAMPQLCWLADAGGQITWFNQRWREFTGLSLEELTARGLDGVHDPGHRLQVQERWAQSVATGEPFEMTFPLRRADGEFRLFLTRAEPIRNEAGKIVRWLGTNTDVSEQQAAEEKLRRLAETLESRVVEAIAQREATHAQISELQKMETIGQLTGGVAHDFNNLLTPIVGNLDLLRRRHEGDDRSQRLLSSALQAADRAKTLVQRLLAFARRQVLEPRAVDTAMLVEGMSDLIRRSIGPRVAIECRAEPDIVAARVDPGQLELALLNLAVNARDAMPGGGTLTIAISEQHVGPGHPAALRHGSYVKLEVSDTGTGMDAATLARAIEPFYSTKGIGKGTGLGLSMVHGLAAQSGGALLLHSEPGQGTRAEIWLPAASTRADGLAGSPTPSTPRTRPLCVLLVDDEELVRLGTAEILHDLGHQVVEAGSGSQALELLRTGTEPDLVITDYLMPGMTGTELAAEIRRERPQLPMLLATGYANLAGDEMASLPLLTKPFRQAEVAARIAELMTPAAGSRPALRAVE